MKNERPKATYTTFQILVHVGSFANGQFTVTRTSGSTGTSSTSRRNRSPRARPSGVVTGTGRVDGRPVAAYSQDFTVAGGSAGEVHSVKVAEIMMQSLKTGSPFVFINDSGGARVQEGIDSLSGYGKVFYTNVMLSGAVPQISLICGPCAGGAAYSPALTDFIIQTRAAQMFITGPQVIKSVTGENVTAEALGGPEAHMTHSGVIHFIAEDDRHAAALCQKLLSFLPSNNLEDPPQVEGDRHIDPNPALDEVVPSEIKKGYDVRQVITGVVDFGDFLEVQAGYAMNIVVGFARITGLSESRPASGLSLGVRVRDIVGPAPNYRKVLLGFIVFLGYVPGLSLIGYLAATFLFVLGLSWSIGPRNVRELPKLVAIAVGTVLATYLIFEKYLYVFLPQGLLF